MTIANDIISHRMPDFEAYLRAGESLDDIDEYGFTPLIETVITRQPDIAEQLLQRKVDVNKSDVTGRTPLHWAVDNDDIEFTKLLLNHGANPNAYTSSGLSVLVYPVLRGQDPIKQLLYHKGAKLDFALDFINAKLIGHRFELKGDVDIVNANGEFIELDYEGFILEFTVAVIKDSLRRFTSSYSTRHLRHYFHPIHAIMDAFDIAGELLRYQHLTRFRQKEWDRLERIARSPMVVLPAASRGHAMGFVRYQHWWAKIDRGENSLQEGTVNIYQITKPDAFNVDFIHQFLYKKQARSFFHEEINRILGLEPVAKLPISPQISGNCSWANIQAVVPVAYALQQMRVGLPLDPAESMYLHDQLVEWDQDRALDEAIQRFYLANPLRKASIASMLGCILFQACSYSNPQHLVRAEKILTILTIPEYYYILDSYLQEYCVKRLTRKGNNLLKILDDCGVNPKIEVHPIASE